jgi:betaine-aldehyde dehydrogenase
MTNPSNGEVTATDARASVAELTTAESRHVGKPIRLSTGFDVPDTIDNAVFVGTTRDLEGKATPSAAPSGNSLIVRSSTVQRRSVTSKEDTA